MTTAEHIALSASYAAWVGAAASSCASVIALSIALLSSRREDRRRRQAASEQEQAFCFAMVGALEMIKPVILHYQDQPTGEHDRRRYVGMIDHAHMIADAGLAIPVLNMQLLRDAYRLRGALSYLRALLQEYPGPVPHAAVAETLDPVLAELIEADDRFFERLPPLDRFRGIGGRTPLRVLQRASGAPSS